MQQQSVELYKWRKTMNTLVVVNLAMLVFIFFVDRLNGWHKLGVDFFLILFIVREAVIEPIGSLFKRGSIEGKVGDQGIKAEFESKE